MKRTLLSLALGVLLLGGTAAAAPVSTHPRLWLTQADLPRLRSWAAPSNPMYAQGLLPALQAAIGTYNNVFFPGGQPNPNWMTQAVDNGGTTTSAYPAEAYAEFFAFMSLVDNDPNARILHAQRARNLLMVVINEAAKGHAAGLPYRDPAFANYDRSRWWGEGFGLTVDWIYNAVDAGGNPILTATDKATIRQVFLLWADDNIHGYMAPPQLGANNPSLLNGGARNAANNYFSGHMRNLTLMALALDAVDDPLLDPSKPANQMGNTLRSYLDNVFGVWMYQQYGLYEKPDVVQQAYNLPASYLPKLGNASGGLSAEGLLYGESLGFVREALLALRTAGYEDATLAGPQIGLVNSAYWDRYVQSFLNSIPPATTVLYPWMGPVYQPGGYGDMLRLYIEPGMSEVFAALNVYDQYTGNTQRAQQSLWIVANAVQGGVGGLFNRASNIWGNANATMGILHFLAFDPASAQNAAQIADPRPALPTEFYDPALGRQLARTDWSTNATFYGYKCSWLTINHQNADCNQFELFRRGEWLTKEHSNYDNSGIGFISDYHNTLSLENDKPADLLWFEANTYSRGSQWNNGRNAGDPTVLASSGSGYAYAQGDAATLYNHPYQWGQGAMDIAQASRSVVWLKPDFIIAYDRATSKTAGRFKRFNLQLVGNPSVLGHLAVDTLPSGQQLFIQNLLPANSSLTALPDEAMNPVADGEPTKYRLVVEDASKPSDVRFLHVLQGADANQAMQSAAHVQSSDGRYEGAVVNNTAVLFQSVLGPAAASVSYVVPQTVDAHVVTGLAPNGTYDLQTQPDPNGQLVTVSAGGSYTADKAGVLSVNTNNLLTGLTPASLSLASAGGAGSVNVSALAGASWSAASNAPAWLSLSGNTAGLGDGNVGFIATANTSTSSRTGTISIGGLTFTVTQKGMVCQPSLSSSSVSAPATGMSGNVSVSVAPGCAWAAASNVPWISVSSASGNGNGSVVYTVQANSGSARSGSVTIAGQAFTVNQAGASSGGACSVSLSIVRKLMIAGASTKAVAVTAPTGCGWTATSSDPSWLSATPASGSGNATVSFTAAANTATTTRSATLAIGGQSVAVTQAGNTGNGCIYAFGTDAQASFPDNTTALHGGGTGSVPVTAPGSCAWTAASNVPWITVTAGASASGNNTVQYSVAANPGGSRTGTLSIAGMAYTVTQN